MIEINKIYVGDSLEVLKTMPENSVDSVVTDPPYNLSTIKRFSAKDSGEKWCVKEGVFHRSLKGFMGKEWDNEIAFSPEIWELCLRVLKPGGYLLSFGGTRTYHRMACAIENAGFEIRDCIMWVYGSGFPKSLNIGKQIDKMAGKKIKKWKTLKMEKNTELGKISPNKRCGICGKPFQSANPCLCDRHYKTQNKWNGWGTALKPAVEPIVVARKPLSEKNVASNVLKWGTGGINIDGCRIESGTEHFRGIVGKKITESDWKNKSGFGKEFKATDNPQGRFPANLLMSCECDYQLKSDITNEDKKKLMDWLHENT